MVVTFRTRMPIGETMCFEHVYEKELQLDLEEKSTIVRDGIAVWMFVDGTLAGETYGISPAKIDGDNEDLPVSDPSVIHCYSTTILPAFQKKHLSKILCAYWIGLAKQAGYRLIAGHTTCPEMTAVKAFFGATFLAEHPRWYGTSRVAHYYELVI